MTQSKNFLTHIKPAASSYSEKIVSESTGINQPDDENKPITESVQVKSIQYKSLKEKKTAGRKPSNIPSEKITIILSVATLNKIKDIALAEGRKGNLHFYRRNAIEAGIDMLHKQYEIAKEVSPTQ